MKIDLLLLFITLFIFIVVGNTQISNFSFISKNSNTVEISEPIIINREGNKLEFRDTYDNSIRVNKICIHDTVRNKTECINKEEILLAQEMPDIRKSMVCMGDSCINEDHAKILNGTGHFFIKTDPLGKSRLQAKQLIYHPMSHYDAKWLNLTWTEKDEIPDVSGASSNNYDITYQLHKFEPIDRRPDGTLNAYGASLMSEVSLPLKTKTDSHNNSKKSAKDLF